VSIKNISIITATLALTACASTGRAPYPNEMPCAPNTPEDICKSLYSSQFNRFVDEGFRGKNKFNFNGYVLSFDKSYFADYAESKTEHCQNTNFGIKGENGAVIDFASAQSAPNGRLKERINKTFTTQRKNMFLADLRHSEKVTPVEYNITTSCPTKKLSLKQTYIDCSFKGLDHLENTLTSELNRKTQIGTPYTHVILLSTGWHNRQEHSVSHFNKFFGNFDKSGEKEDFNPLYIGITWPSDWNIKFVSYINKKSDADEIGLIWANYLINKTIPTAIENTNVNSKPKFVAIGHSFGARVVATGVSSKSYITSYKPLEPLDTLILKQPAFSRSRLAEHKEMQGYSNFNYYANLDLNADKIIVTASRRDNYLGNGIAFWSGGGTGHAGTARSYKKTRKFVDRHPETWGERFTYYRQNVNGNDDWEELLNKTQTPILYLRLDADGKNNDIITGHNGVKSQKLTDVFYEFIK